MPDTALTNLALCKIYLNQQTDAEDDRLAVLVRRASTLISTFCNRTFLAANYTEYYDGSGSANLWLNNWPVAQPITTASGGGVWVDSSYGFSDSYKLVEELYDGTGTGQYIIRSGEEGQGCLVRLDGVWPNSPRVIKVLYQGGYVVTAIPEDVQFAATRLTAYLFKRAQKGAHIQSSESLGTGGGETRYVLAELPEDVKEMLVPWKRVVI